MAKDSSIYHFYKRFKRHSELVAQMQDIMAPCNQIQEKFSQFKNLFQEAARWAEKEFIIFTNIVAKETAEKRIQQQQNYQATFVEPLAEPSNSELQLVKIDKAPRSQVVKRKSLVSELKAQYNLANYYSREGNQFLRKKIYEEAMKRFKSARTILLEGIEQVGCNHDMQNLSSDERAKSDQVYDWAAILLKELNSLIKKHSGRQKFQFSKLDSVADNMRVPKRRASLNSFFEPAKIEKREIRRLSYGRLSKDAIKCALLELEGNEPESSLNEQNTRSPLNAGTVYEMGVCINAFFEAKKLRERDSCPSIKRVALPTCG